MDKSAVTLNVSQRRRLVREIAFDRRGRAYGKVRAGWSEDSGSISYRPSIVIFPGDFDGFLAGLEKFTKVLDSPEGAGTAPVPTAPDLATSGARFCFHIPDRPGKRAAVVATFRVSQSGKSLRALELYVYQNEGQQVLGFLKELRDDLATLSKTASSSVGTPSAIKTGAPAPEAPASAVLKPAEPSVPGQREVETFELSEFESELLERFDHKRWQELVEEKCELERKIFSELCNRDDRTDLMDRLQSVLGEMNDFCAIKEGEEQELTNEDY